MSMHRVVSSLSLVSTMLIAAACNNEAAPITSPSAFGGNGNGGAGIGTNGTGGGTVLNPSGGSTSSANGGSSQSATTGGSSVGSATGGSNNNQTGGATSAGGSSQTGGAKATGGTSTQVGGNTAAGGSTGQTGGASSVGGGTSTDPLGGYHVHGDWAGFAFTYASGGATITPDGATGFKTMTDKDGPYCGKGSILGTADYSSSAAVGFNTKQDKIADAPTGKITPSGTGLLVNVSNPGNSPSLRVQIEDGTDPTAADAAQHRWCVNISEFGKDIVIPWASFNTECWSGGKGTAFNPTTQLAKALVFLPSDGKTTLSFDFCVNKIGPDTVKGRGTGTIGSSCNNTVSWSQSTVTGQYDNIASGDGKYRFQANGWGWQGNSSHNISLATSCGFTMTSQSCSRSDSTPCSYPSVYIGTNSGGSSKTSGNGLPKQVSSLTSAPTCLGWKAGSGANDEYNVSYDVWFNSSSGATNADTFLMLWFRKPPTFQPAGAPKADGVVIGSQTWTVWYGPNAAGQNVVSYLAVPNNLAQGQAYSFNLKDFIDDAVARSYLTTSKYLIAVMGGLEIWGGGTGAGITHFKAEVQ